MSQDLREAIEKAGRSSACKCWTDRTNEFYADMHRGIHISHYVLEGYEAGFTAALDLLWPCVEALQVYEGDEFWQTLNSWDDTDVDNNAETNGYFPPKIYPEAAAKDTLKELKAKVGG